MAAATAALSLCSSLTPKLSKPQTTTSISLSRTNICCLSNSLSALTLRSARKQRTLSFVTKASDEDAAEVSVMSPEAENVDEAAVEAEKPKREEIFAVVMVGGRQYIVHPGRYIYTQRLKGANVNDKVTLNKVLLVGTKTSTWIGYPIVQNATVEAIVEEQTLDKKVIVFKYKKKKNYRRNIGHRQPITRIRVTSITGYQDSPAVTLPETSLA